MNSNKIFFILFLISVSVTAAQTFVNFNTGNSGIPENNVTSISVSGSTIWFTTINGLASFDGIDWRYYNSDEELISNNLLSSANNETDTMMTLIVGSDSGASELTVQNQDIISPPNHYNTTNSSILSDLILSAAVDKMGSRWLGTDKGISIVYSDDSIMNLQSSDGGVKLYSDWINSIAVAHDTVRHVTDEYVPYGGVIYAATNGGGIGRFYQHEIDGITSASIVEKKWSGLPSDTVLTVFVNSENIHWYGTTKGAAAHEAHDSKNTEWLRYDTDDGLIHNTVTSIAQDSSGNMWFGTLGGLSKYDWENWTSYTESDGLIDNAVNDLKIDKDNILWIATENGISKLDPVTSVSDKKFPIKDSHEMKLAVYPNPFNPVIKIKLYVEIPSEIRLDIYNITGELIKTVEQSFFREGNFLYSWNAENDFGTKVNSGVYLLRAVSSNTSVYEKILYLK